MHALLKIAIIATTLYSANHAQAAVTFQSYQLNTSGLTVLPNPFADLEVLSNNQYRISVTSLYYAPTLLTLFISDSLTELEVHSISSSPVTSLFVGDPMIPNSGFVAYSWQETFTVSQDLANDAEDGQLFFSYFDDSNMRQTARFYTAIPEPSGFLLCAVAFSISMVQRKRTKCEQDASGNRR